MGKLVAAPYERVVARVREALKAEGFGIVTEMDVQATMKEKLGLDMRPYVILGACNPVFASQVLAADPELGLLLPCNVLVYETDEGTRVSAVDPEMMLQMAGSPAVADIAADVKERLGRAVQSV
jgi:uncharacterized protein (DUF302 family)